ncbi:MAG TPA: sulfate permease [Spirochaetota bacterium]|nr:sulfate permease [Spirochaetota bacterium]HOS31849.1 sulfate permease [Spirochaetota bacterium]HOS56143.1 sulfate permease [Spirochaetota bacterium]HPK61714.1 sulfate permease [Spirochaetota bacterium]HQJ05143.1 sulfate permease [Spirochaetota bacterium]
MKSVKYTPKLITVFKEGYSFKTFTKDLSAGVIVGIVALPLSIAFAIASGVKPEQGLYTAIVAGIVISILSGSRVQIGGPTGAFIVMLYGIVQKYGYDGLAVAGIMAGILLVIMGIAGLGSVIKFIPYPVTVGFTTGIALIIFTTQIKDFLGLQIDKVPAEFINKIIAYSQNILTVNPYALLIGGVSIVIMILWKKVSLKIPGSLIAIIVSTLIVLIFKLPVDTIGSKFGSVPNMLPLPKFPHIDFKVLPELFQPALSIALLAGIESLLSAVVADGMTGGKHRSNMELIAQGAGNIVSPLFCGIPATGAIARTATNIKNGGTTPIAGIIHCVTLLLIMLFFGKLAALIPMPALSAILIMVAYNMSEIHIFVKIFKSTKSDVIVLLVTFLLTVILDLTVAIQVGVVLASLLFMYRMSNVSQVGKMIVDDENETDANSIKNKNVPAGVEVYEIYGSFFFGAAEKFKDQIKSIEKKPKILILRMRNVLMIDATGLTALETIIVDSQKQGIKVVLSGVRTQMFLVLQKSGLVKKLGEENVAANIDLALARANEILSEEAEI